MITSQAVVVTDRASRYLTQLCKHFAHKVHAEWDESKGYADFGWGTCTLTATSEALVLDAQAPDGDGLDRVEHVVGDHATRFGVKDNLTVTWKRD